MATQNSINNTSKPLASTAVTIDPGSAADSYVQFNINGTSEWRIGSANSASASFKMSQGSAFGTKDSFIMTTAGNRTMPLNCAFMYVNNADQTNVTGDGTMYTVQYNNSIFDQSSSFSVSTFTAPITGKYLLGGIMDLGGITTAMTNALVYITTTGGTYRVLQDNFASNLAPSTFQIIFTTMANMTAGDTATVTIWFLNGTKAVTLFGATSSTLRTPMFYGYLMC